MVVASEIVPVLMEGLSSVSEAKEEETAARERRRRNVVLPEKRYRQKWLMK